MANMSLLLTALVITVFISETLGLRCYNCTGIDILENCFQSIECQADEQCHSEKYVTENEGTASVKYDLGCMSNWFCGQLDRFKNRSMKRNSDLVIWNGCCSHGHCNQYFSPTGNQEELSCIQCKDATRIEDCTTSVVCQHGQRCFTEKYLEKNNTYYRRGCQSEELCDVYKNKTGSILWYGCCGGSNCNAHLSPPEGPNGTSTTSVTTPSTTAPLSPYTSANTLPSASSTTKDVSASGAAMTDSAKYPASTSSGPLSVSVISPLPPSTTTKGGTAGTISPSPSNIQSKKTDTSATMTTTTLNTLGGAASSASSSANANPASEVPTTPGTSHEINGVRTTEAPHLLSSSTVSGSAAVTTPAATATKPGTLFGSSYSDSPNRTTAMSPAAKTTTNTPDVTTSLVSSSSPTRGGGLQCLECGAVERPEDCRTSALCRGDEVCFTGKYNEHGKTAYRYKCETSQACAQYTSLMSDPASRRDDLLIANTSYSWVDCCSDRNNCNRDLCLQPPCKSATPSFSTSGIPTATATTSVISSASVLLTTERRGETGVTCLQCEGVDRLENCHASGVCQQGNRCFAGEYRDQSGDKVYHLGCENSAMCDVYKKLSTGDIALTVRRRQSVPFTGDMYSWYDCCKGDNCNRAVCPSPPCPTSPTELITTTPTANVKDVQCLKCDRVNSPDECNTRDTCGHDEVCFTREYVDHNDKLAYHLGCFPTQICSIINDAEKLILLGRRGIVHDPHLCFGCCSEDTCNSALCTDSTRAPVIATNNTATSTATTAATSNGCPRGFIKWMNKCYMFELTHLKWNDARADCKSHGADLASVNTKEEDIFIVSQLDRMKFADTVYGMWLGGSFNEEQQRFTWVDGTDIIFHRFADGNLPALGEFHVEIVNPAINEDFTGWPWSLDFGMFYERGYICEMESLM